MDHTATLAREFERESYRIDQMIWDAMALRPGETALFCGVSNNLEWIKRATAIGVDVSIIASDNDIVNDLRSVAVKVLRGSTSMLPARDASYTVSVAFHYLHEVDPFFHANVVSELARVSERCVIVEPAPPSDPLGLRIAALYSQAKRELGQFEQYHHIDYWRKLLSIVKSDVRYQTFSFERTPPRWAIRDTVAMVIDMMAAEETPESYLAELRALARRPDAQLLPQSRFVVVGTAAGVQINTTANTDFRDWLPEEMRPGQVFASPFKPADLKPRSRPAAGKAPKTERVYSPAQSEPEFPDVEARPITGVAAGLTRASKVARNAFGLPANDIPPLRSSAVPTVRSEDEAFGPAESAVDAAAEFGWEWETPGES